MHKFVPSAAQVDVGDPVFQDECYNNVVEADANNDGRITPEEYVILAQMQGPPGIVDDVTSFAQLPPEYRAVFNVLACLCSDPVFGGTGNDMCCVGNGNQNIRVPAAPGDGQSDQDLRMLFAICALTDSAAEEVSKGRPPTNAPTAPPNLPPTNVPTTQPTNVPTAVPTESPVVGTRSPVATTMPTISPTSQPTRGPTGAPTLPPTGNPTANPTIAPTTLSQAPTTLAPTSNPTLTQAPTDEPTGQPTFKPTVSPAPTSSPTTSAPTIAPTDSPTITPILIQTFVNYSVAFVDARNKTDQAGYFSDLMVAMDVLADDVAADIWGQRRRLQETLSVRAVSPTDIVEQTPFGK